MGSPKVSSAPYSEERASFDVVVVIGWGPRLAAKLLVMIVRESRGISSFFVRRMDAEEADRAERKARWRAESGTRRFMVLFSAAD